METYKLYDHRTYDPTLIDESWQTAVLLYVVGDYVFDSIEPHHWDVVYVDINRNRWHRSFNNYDLAIEAYKAAIENFHSTSWSLVTP